MKDQAIKDEAVNDQAVNDDDAKLPMLKGLPGYTVYGRGCLGMAAEPADGISSSGQPADVITNQSIFI